jgi:hypothetical protein
MRTDGLEEMGAVVGGCVELERRPQLCGRRILEPFRHHANDRVGLTVQRNPATDDGGIAAESVPPHRMTQDHDFRSARNVFVRGEGASQERMDAHDIEEAGRDVRSEQPFGPARAHEVEAGLETVVGSHVLEDVPAFGAPAHELRHRRRGAKARRITTQHLHETVRVWKRQRTQKRGIDHGEDGRRGPDGQGERQDDGGRISGSLAKNPNRLPRVAPQIARQEARRDAGRDARRFIG